ncbi:Retrovirus-related Pol polyprotein from transposon opus [Gossypium australe]|uniref:Retrovirus-related Pol polyprotein from transposon opus n=1 Tax=Gossypium australe TaxID=47621 RepID=A0A5B6V9J0_9ROSI|nr:Retrovirus-related Pol polyprotein from transposon opus [Gossypium australe]
MSIIQTIFNDKPSICLHGPFSLEICHEEGNKRQTNEIGTEQRIKLQIIYQGWKWELKKSPIGGHFERRRKTQKILQSIFYWPTMIKDAYEFAQQCDICQRMGNILKRDEMPQNGILEVEVFYFWSIEFMGLFPSSVRNQYILLAVDYISKWVEAIALPANDTKVMLEAELAKYSVKHRITIAGHPQANG